MIKKLISIPTFLVGLMLMYQLVFPVGNVLVSANTSMLPPSNLAFQSVTPDDGRLTWNPVVEAAGYKIYEIKEGQLVLLGETKGTNYSLNDLTEGTFRYVVSTLSSSDGESGPSAPVSADIVYPNMLAPEGMSSTIRYGNDIYLSWDAAQYAEKYNVYESSATGEKTLLTDTTARSYRIESSVEGTFTYTVSAEHSLYGESPMSTKVNVIVDYPVIEQPAGLSFTVSNGTDVTLKWQAVDYANSYNIYQVIDGQQELVSTVTGTSVKYTKLPAGDYEYKVYSYSDRFGESAEGSSISLTVSSIVMTAPENATYRILNTNDANLSWDTVPNATAYKVYQIVDGERILTSTITGTAVTYRMLTAGDYQYEIHSYSDRFGEAEVGSKVSFSIETVSVQPPTNLTYQIKNGNDIALTWEASVDADNYNIYQVINGEKVLERTVTGKALTLSNQAAGDYVFEVYANSSRFGESAEGVKVALTVDPVILGAPEAVTFEIRNGNDIALSWDQVEFAANYKVYQIVAGEKVLKRTLTGTATTFGNMPEGDYTYEVYANSTRFGEAPDGTEVQIQVVHPDLEAPKNSTNTIKSPTSFSLSWDAVDYATGYKVYLIENGQKTLKSSPSGTIVNFNNMVPGNYTYEVYSYSSRFGESMLGTPIEVVVEGEVLAAPENLSYSFRNGNDLTLRWDAAQYATNYNIYQLVDGNLELKRTITGTATTFTNMPEGEFEFIVKANSTLLGESPVGAEAKGFIEYSAMKNPGELSHTILNGNDIRLSWNSVEFASAYNIYQVNDDEKELVKTITGTATILTNMPEGDYSFEVHSYSDRFGESPEASELDITIDFPIMQAPENLRYSINNGNDLVLRWDASLYATEYKVYQIIDGKEVLQKNVKGTATIFTNMPEGNYEYVVYSYSDRFDESPGGSELGFDLIWPTVQAPEITGSIFNANNITLAWPAVTWANGYRVYQVSGTDRELLYEGPARSFKVYNLTEDTHSFEVTAYSTRFGESIASNQITEKIVYPIMEPPTASLKLLSDTSARISWNFITYANGYNIYEVIDGEPVLIVENLNNLSYTLQNLTYANHVYYVTSYSNSFGESASSETVLAKLIVDTQAPDTKINAPSQWVNENQLVTLEATDDESGVENTFYSLNFSFMAKGTSVSVDQEGVNNISYYSVDKVGNIEEVKTAEVKIDKTAPDTEINELPDLAQSFKVQLTGNDELSGVAATYYSINGSEYIEGTSFVIEEEGINEISYYSVDVAGNKEDVKTVEVRVDTTAPVTSVDAPDSWVKDDVTVTLVGKDEQSGVAQTYYSINGSKFVEGTSFVINTEGINEISYYSVDMVGNKEEVRTAEVRIDQTAPTLSVSVEGEYELGSTFTVDYVADDSLSGVAAEEVTLNGKPYVKGDTISFEQTGEYQLLIKVTDAAGWTTVEEKTFTVYIPVTLEVLPKVIKGNKGVFTVKATLPKAYQSYSFDVSSVTLNGVSAVADNKGLQKQAEKGHFKFEREDFTWITGEVELELRGSVNNQLVIGKATAVTKK